MNLLLIYLLGVVIILGLSFLAVGSFWRYRFKGDRTQAIIIGFYIAFVAVVIGALLLVNPSALSPSSVAETTFQ